LADDEQILKELENCVISYDLDNVQKLAKDAIEAGIDPARAISEGLSLGMLEVGRKFDDAEIFLPEVMLAAEVMKKGLEPLRAKMLANGKPSSGKRIVIGTVYGDIHDIGKNIVGIMLEATGYEVFDVGKDVPPEVFVEKAKEVDAALIGSSSLMTTTKWNQRKITEILEEEGLTGNIKLMVGGASVNDEWAKEINAHYARDAFAALKLTPQLI